MTERATCETCRWWERNAIVPEIGGCRHSSVVGPYRQFHSADADVSVLRFAVMTCGEHQPREVENG